MQSLDSLDRFYRSLENIAVVNSDLDEYRESLRNLTVNFNQKMQDRSVEKSVLEKNPQIAELTEETLAKLKQVSQKWVEDFEGLLQEEKFRSDLENYFIVIVFGKVNSGKSSLGNFIARHNTLEDKVSFFRYDEAGKEESIRELEEIDEEKFSTDNLECTISIQGFKLSGLAWIDTPGLGSMVRENGELAKAYIKAADYIIFPTSSADPMQQDERAQIKELIDYNKKVTVCITKSDTKERRKKDGKYLKDPKTGKIGKFLVNKSTERRAEQERYVREEISKATEGNEHFVGDVLSLSAHTAQMGLDNNDEEMFEGSNIPKFYVLMADVIEHKASSIKNASPYGNLLAFIENNIVGENKGEMHRLQEGLDYFDEQIAEARDKFVMIKQNTDSDIASAVHEVVSEYALKITKENIQKMLQEADEEIERKALDLIGRNIGNILQNFHTSLIDLEGKMEAVDTFKVEDKYKEIRVKYDNSGIFRRIMSSVGIMDRKYKTLREKVHVGDNKEEIIAKYIQTRTDAFTALAHANYDQVEEVFFSPIMDISAVIRKDLRSLTEEALSLKGQIEEKAK